VKALLDLYYRIEAKYAVVLVNSHEEGRFIRSIKAAIEEFDKESHAEERMFYTWSMTEGMIHHTEVEEEGEKAGKKMVPHLAPVENTGDITEVLAWIKKKGEEEMAELAKRKNEDGEERLKAKKSGRKPLPRRVYILKDPHPFIEIAPVRRYIRDLAEILPLTKGATVILLSPQLTLPSDIEKQVSIVDFPLPTVDELVPFVKKMIKDCKKRLKKGKVPTDAAEIFKIARACVGLTYSDAENVISRSIIEHGEIRIEEISGEKKQIIMKSGIMEILESDLTLDQLGGMEDAKEEIQMMIAESDDPAAAEHPLEPPRGMVFSGPAGTGKTAIAKAIANERKTVCVSYDLGALKGSHVGETEAKQILSHKIIESLWNPVVVLDEAEKNIPQEGAYQGDGGTGEGAVGRWLSFLQNSKCKMLWILTCNDPRVLRPAAIRAGRIDSFWWNDLPSAEQREKILAIHLSKRKRNPEDYDLEEVASNTEDYSGAELEETVKKGLRICFHKKRPLETKDLVAGAKQVMPVAVTMKEKIADLREWAKTRARPTSKQQTKGRRAVANSSREL
jgi:AAA+ superfamily predicted ATPase